ncbi:hypothetical protein HK097_009781 [Rhizophlyctis rosea]|uniref:F-box domain-containing protein n=1 Tax=Rhizophlyctis rosea TaxID=64517 RepID=A0AAD5SKM1_9FUNG|nr:hypothetical protein HK097_009781 [Rhizophlyctis rosea]
MMFPPLPSKLSAVGGDVLAGGQGILARSSSTSSLVITKVVTVVHPQPRRRGSNSSISSACSDASIASAGSSLVDEGYGSWEDGAPIKYIGGKSYAESAASTPERRLSYSDMFTMSPTEEHDCMNFSMDMEGEIDTLVMNDGSRTTAPSMAAHLLPELLHTVFSILSTTRSSNRQRTLAACTRVNRYWHAVATPTLYAHPDLATEHAIDRFVKACVLSGRGLGAFGGNGIHVRTLDLSKVRLHEPSHTFHLRTLASACRKIRTLKLWCEGLDLRTLQSLTSASPHLDTLVVAGHLAAYPNPSHSHTTTLTPQHLLKALNPFMYTTLPRLKTLQIDIGFDGDIFRSHLATLITSHLSPACTHFRMGGADMDAHVTSLVRHAPNLKSVLYAWANLSEESVLTLAEHLRGLRVVDLRGCQKAVTERSIAELVGKCKDVESLDISFTSTSVWGTNAILETLEGAEKIHTLILAGTTPSAAALKNLIRKKGGQLRCLSLAWVSSVDDSVGEDVSVAISVLVVGALGIRVVE